MKVKRTKITAETIESFARCYDLTMLITERDKINKDKYFSACFEHLEIRYGDTLINEFGTGMTEGEAIRDYSERISGRLCEVITPSRGKIEVKIPILVPHAAVPTPRFSSYGVCPKRVPSGHNNVVCYNKCGGCSYDY